MTKSTNLMLVLSAVVLITSGVSLIVFMNSLDHDSAANRYPNSRPAIDIDDDISYNFNSLNKPGLTE